MDKAYTYKKDLDKQSNATVTVTVDSAKFVEQKDKTYIKLAKDVAVTGFRPGKAPKSVIEAKLGGTLYEETLNNLLPEITSEILFEEKLEPITQVKYEVKKVSDDDGVEYVASFVVYPEIKLGDFSKIKLSSEEAVVTEESIDQEIKRFEDLYAKRKAQEEAKDKKEDGEAEETNKAEKEETKPEKLTDEMVKSLNIGVDTVEDLKKQIKMQLEYQSKTQAEEKKVQELLDQAVKLSDVQAPQMLVEGELHKREHDYTARIEQIGLKVDEFLKSQNTTLEDLKKSWQTEAQQKVAIELLLYAVVKQEKLDVSLEEINKEVDTITDEKLKKEYNSDSGRRYIASVILQQKALKWLREQVNT